MADRPARRRRPGLSHDEAVPGRLEGARESLLRALLGGPNLAFSARECARAAAIRLPVDGRLREADRMPVRWTRGTRAPAAWTAEMYERSAS